jgi:hypothetical protein
MKERKASRSTWIHALGLVVLLSLCALPSPASADDFMGGVRFGYYFDAEKPFVGGELLVRMAHRLYFNPNVEYVFVDNGSYLSFNADFHYDFPRHTAFYWLGGGLGVIVDNPEGPDNSDTTLAANFLAGVGFRAGSVIPYFQVKAIAKSNAEFAIAFGLRF